jgi:hypothetical protein
MVLCSSRWPRPPHRAVSGEAPTGLDATREFFLELGRRGYEPALVDVTGTVQIEVVGASRSDNWVVVIDNGHVTVSTGDADADCSLRVDEDLFETLIRGEANAMAAVLRGSAVPSGDIELLVALQRLFPGPADQRRPAPIGRSTRWTP